MTASELITSLNLEEYEEATIQKIIGGRSQEYLITINSRYAKKFIPYNVLKNTPTAQPYRLTSSGLKRPRLTPPAKLNSFSGDIPTNSYIVVRDIGGDLFLDPRDVEPYDLII